MKESVKTISYTTGSIDELAQADRQLVDAARAACDTAYAPHSGFRVGAAALLDSGEIVRGSNQESDVYPAGMCAERVLLYAVGANRPSCEIVAVAVAAKREDCLADEVFPCGACAQTLVDMEKRQKHAIRLILTSGSTFTLVRGARLLLPFEFKLK